MEFGFKGFTNHVTVCGGLYPETNVTDSAAGVVKAKFHDVIQFASRIA